MQVFRFAYRSLTFSPVSSCFTIGSLATILYVVGVFFLFGEKVNQALDSVGSVYSINVYLSDSISDSAKEAIEKSISVDDAVVEYSYHSKDWALRDFRTRLGQSREVLEGINTENNPLPASFELKVSSLALPTSNAREFIYVLKQFAGVEDIRFDNLLVDTVDNIYSWYRVLSFALLPIIVAISVFIMWSTIMLALASQREEIEILGLVGATDTYIIMPFIFLGIIFGLFSSIIAVVLIYTSTSFAFELVNGFIPNLEFLALSSSIFSYSFISVLFLGLSSSVLGSLVAVRGYIVNLN